MIESPAFKSPAPYSWLRTPDSQYSFVRKTVIPGFTNNNMVHNFYVKILSSFFDLKSQFFVGTARFETAGWVVMTKNDTDGVFFQCFFQDQAGIGYGAGNSSFADNLKVFY